MKQGKTIVASGTTGAAGSAGIVDNWTMWGGMDWLGDMVPVLLLAAWLLLVIGGAALWSLHRRVKALENAK